MQRYLVGGAVRDKLLGRPVRERDWVLVGARPDELIAAGYRQVGKDFPVFLDPHSGDECALARTERKSGSGYTGFAVHAAPDVTLEEDLLRRDLTINAIAESADGELIDPYGGRADLDARRLRHVSTAFVEDPLRVLRVARFAARYHHLGFAVAPETIELMGRIANSGELATLVHERVWQETQRALGERDPQIYFAVLRECGALAEIFPEIERLFGVPQKAQWHPEIDTGVHNQMVLEQTARLSNSPLARFAALCHDLGKGTTPADILPSHHGHEERGAKIAEAMCARLRAPREYRDIAVLTARWHSHCHRAFELRPDTLLKTLEGCDALRRPQRFELFLLACTGDARGRTGHEGDAYPQADYFRGALAAAQSIDAAAIARSVEGPEVPKAIAKARIAALTQYKAGAGRSRP